MTRSLPTFARLARLARLRLPARLALPALLGAGPLLAQDGTDIYLVELPQAQAGAQAQAGVPESVIRVTDRAGYDNQPAFTPDGTALLYTVIDAAGQADIWRWDVATRERRRLTATSPESEYSAAVLPQGGRFSVVRVERDSTQRLWSFDLASGGDARLVLEDVAPVGYYAWGSPDTLALFVLGDPATLQVADARGGPARVVASDIGRSIRAVPGRHAVSYAQSTGDAWTLMLLDLETLRSTPLAPAPSANEHHVWTPDGRLLIAADTRILVSWASAGAGAEAWERHAAMPWVELLDLSAAGIRIITRLAVSPDGRWLALVAPDPGF
ncbi:MAG: hypothetical protein ACRELV_02370 [Longimicrobiales bacterium]